MSGGIGVEASAFCEMIVLNLFYTLVTFIKTSKYNMIMGIPIMISHF